MRRTATAILLAAGLALAGCGGTPAKPAAAKSKPSPSVDRDGQFITAVEDANLSFNERHPSNDELLVFPPKWCAGLKAGHSVKYLFGIEAANLYPAGDDWGLRVDDATKLLVIGVHAFCPQFESRVTDELRASGDY